MKLVPIDVRDVDPILWPSQHVKKIILMSATIGLRDIEAMGLGKDRGYRTTLIEAKSPIPPDRRPVYLDYSCGNGCFRFHDQYIPKLATFIEQKRLEHPGQKGLVHVTYNMGRLLQKYLDNPLYLWHTKDNRSEVYNNFLKTPANSGAVLIASGLYEGIDLKGDLGRWQILGKVPWPNLGDAAMQYKAQHDSDFYNWEALKKVLQMSGRVCRTPTDRGETYIVDGSFDRLLKEGSKYVPGWFKEALVS
jgi:Rad3-related DNA helicase